jgi:ribonuclease HI
MAIKIFCDGSTRINNKKGAKNEGGFGYVAFDSKTNYIIDAYSKQVKNTTNNEMELYALYYAIAHFGTADDWGCPEIYCDSQYAINCATVWGRKWMVNNWMKSDGKPVENQQIIYDIHKLLASGKFRVNINYIKGHSGIIGNELADKLATGVMTPEEVYFSDVKNNIPNMGYFTGKDNWRSDCQYKDDPQYWITGIEDGWIYPNKALRNWYKQYKQENSKNDTL